MRPGQINFIDDSGTVNGVMGKKEKAILKNVAEEDILIETVTGKISITKLYRDTVFGKTQAPKDENHAKMNVLITTVHQQWAHANSNKLKNILKIDKHTVADGITAKDVDN